jgi:hypothetical protein
MAQCFVKNIWQRGEIDIVLWSDELGRAKDLMSKTFQERSRWHQARNGPHGPACFLVKVVRYIFKLGNLVLWDPYLLDKLIKSMLEVIASMHFYFLDAVWKYSLPDSVLLIGVIDIPYLSVIRELVCIGLNLQDSLSVGGMIFFVIVVTIVLPNLEVARKELLLIDDMGVLDCWLHLV